MLSTFVTPIAYVVIAGFLILSGFFFFSAVAEYNGYLFQTAAMPENAPNLNEFVVYPFYRTLEVILIFLIPVLTMRSFAEEKAHGTFELLVTSPLKVGEIVWGKFLGLGVVIIVMLLLSFIYPLVLMLVMDPEVMPLFIGLLGMILFALSFLSIGIACSAFTKSQTIAAVMGIILLLLFYVVDAPAGKVNETVARVLSYLAPATHSDFLLKGVIAGSDLVYFVSVIFVGLFATSRILEAERWRSGG